MPKAFVSYAREDKPFVDQHLKPVLTALHIDLWVDADKLSGAERWQETIERALPECDYFFVVVTAAGAASPAVRGEVEWILKHRDGRLIPLLAERTRLDGIHPELPEIQHLDCIKKQQGQTATLVARAMLHLAHRTGVTLRRQKEELATEIERKEQEWDDAHSRSGRSGRRVDFLGCNDPESCGSGHWR